MEKFLAEAFLPKVTRKRPVGQAQDGGSTAAKRPRPRRQAGPGNGDDPTAAASKNKLEPAQPEVKSTKLIVAPEPAPATESAPTRPTTNSSTAPLPSFRDVMAGQGIPAGPTRTRQLCEMADSLVQKGQHAKGLRVLKRALIACACQAPLRRQFQSAGVALESIDPIGHCSCRDFVAAAQTRRLAIVTGRPTRSTLKKPDGSSFAISELDLTAVHNLATNGTACMCGSGRTRCTLPDHLEALDRLAQVAAQLGQADLAVEVSQWYIDLAPHQAQGYLHLAKAVLLKEPQARFKALCIYNHGRHNVRQHGDPENPFMRYLTRGCRQYNQCDFLVCLPRETAELIFDQLSLTDVLTCLRVSKEWAVALRQMRLRLASVRLPGTKFLRVKPQKQPPLKGLGKLLRSLPGLRPRHLSIRFKLNPGPQYAQFVEETMRHLKGSIESLELSTWWGAKAGREPVWTLRGGPNAATDTSRCRKLVLHDEDSDGCADIKGIVGWASDSVEHLELKGIYKGVLNVALPRLRVFKADKGSWSTIVASDLDGTTQPCIVPSICVAAPKLEQLSLDGIVFLQLSGQPTDEQKTAADNLFQSLHTLYIGPGCRVLPSFTAFPKLPPGMRCIDIACTHPDVAELILFNTGSMLPGQGPYLRPFEKLESFRCVALQEDPQRVFDLIRPSLNGPDGRLAHIELPAESLGMDFVQGDGSYRFDYPERIRTVGLHRFNWNPGPTAPHMLGHVLRDGPFLDWVAQFRNAESISVYPMWQISDLRGSGAGNAAQDGQLIVELVRRVAAMAKQEDSTSWNKMRLRTVYQGLLHGHMHGYMENLQKETFGELLIRFPAGHGLFREPVFPWPDLVEEVAEAENA